MQTETDADDPTRLPHDEQVSADESLTGVLRRLAADGFDASFRPTREPVEGQAAVVCGACGRAAPAADLQVLEERRLEGASDPDDMVLVVAASCPACGARGTIALGYGPEASPEDSDLVVALHDPGEPASGAPLDG
ncbi:MAG: hypothetical protein JWO77_2986 [Ilumatobacteraceae bacterium]|nr:hypothetical protein [Ilumatobacteraceae bacterium]